MTTRHARSLAFAILVVFAGCLDRSEAPGLSAAALAAGDASGDDDDSTAGIIMMNGLPPNALALNALTTNTDPTTVQALVASPLTDDTFANGYGQLRVALHDNSAYALLRKIVKCALPHGSVISWTDPFPNAVRATSHFHGQLGLASGWVGRGATLDEQQLVSACVMMLMNEEGAHVAVSPRGLSGVPQTYNLLDASQSAHAFPFDASGARAFGFQHCDSAASGLRACGWDETQSYVGHAKLPASSAAIWAGIGGEPAPNTVPIGRGDGSPSMVRVCQGASGCDDVCANDTCRFLGEQDGSVNGMGAYYFDPTSAAESIYDSFFTVMAAPHVANIPNFWASPVAAPALNVALPAQVLDVYQLAEAGWMGNLFSGVAHGITTVSVDSQTGDLTYALSAVLPWNKGTNSVYPNMYYCSAHDWGATYYYAVQRLCGMPSASPSNCNAVYLGPCASFCSAPGIPQGDYEGCHDDKGRPWHALTSYLYGACDIDPKNCH